MHPFVIAQLLSKADQLMRDVAVQVDHKDLPFSKEES